VNVVTITIERDVTKTMNITKIMFPKMEAAVNYKTGFTNINVSLSFNSYTLVDAVSGTDLQT